MCDFNDASPFIHNETIHPNEILNSKDDSTLLQFQFSKKIWEYFIRRPILTGNAMNDNYGAVLTKNKIQYKIQRVLCKFSDEIQQTSVDDSSQISNSNNNNLIPKTENL